MDDRDIEHTDDDTTSVVRVREARALLEDITARHRSQTDKPAIGWFQRFLSWFKGTGTSD